MPMSVPLPFPMHTTSQGANCVHNADPHQEQMPTQPEYEPGKPMLCLNAPRLDITSIHRSIHPLQFDDESLSSPIESMSPVVFRRYDDDWSDSYLTRGSDSVFSYSSTHTGAWYHHTSYNFLSPQRVPSSSSHRSLLTRPPSRSSSLRSLHTRSAPMSRAPSPSPSESAASHDRCSERMVFAPNDLDELEFSSVPTPPSHSPSSSGSSSSPPIWLSWKSSKSAHSRSDPSLTKSTTSLQSEQSQKTFSSLAMTNIRIPSEPILDVHSPSVMSGSLSPWAHGAPTPIVTPKRSKPKVKPRSLSSASSTSDEYLPEKTFKATTLRRMRQLVARKSISSLDAMLSGVSKSDPPHSPTTTFTSTSTSEQTTASPARSHTPSSFNANSNNFTDHLPAITITPSDTVHDSVDVEHTFSAHRIIHGVWKKQEISDVIPVLRSMRFGGK
ncbi:hypothetical protein BDY19DRAFT_946052 [Irpex rosettiformis]|uniref:Uncharacterized protein n=1 Tax=Irpex rosettiformis TaxID=378272 RepID=A0ACB8U3J2_9APHY|nr:hypothetical protein BDY19DRAFT_946052 [Irpex rosettiformis]